MLALTLFLDDADCSKWLLIYPLHKKVSLKIWVMCAVNYCL